ncbi:MAG: RNA ligase family protein, partial [bacterium]
MGGQAAINLISISHLKHLEYIRLKPNNQSIDEMEQIIYLLSLNNLCDPKCNFELGSTRLFMISAGLLKPNPNEIETLEVINKAKEIKTDFGDLDIGIKLQNDITPQIVTDFFNKINPAKYRAVTNGTEVSIAVCLNAYPNKVIQIDLVCMKDEVSTTFNHFASMADMAVGIKGVARDVLIRSIAACYPIKDDLMDILRQAVKTSEACKSFSEKYKNNKPNFSIRYSMMTEGLAYHITWLVDGKQKTFSRNGVDMNYLHKILPNLSPIGFDKMEMIAKTLGFKDQQHLYHATTMAKVISSYDSELRQKIWDKFTDTMKTKAPTSTRIVGQITEAELTTTLRYLKPYFSLPMVNVIRMPSIPHWDQMSAAQYEKLLDGNALEVSEKYDGSNISFGVNEEGKVYAKSKRGIAITDPNEFDNMAMLYDNDIFHEFANILQFLQDIHFETICPTGVQIFGEMFCKARMNVIAYNAEIIGTGLVVVFGAYKNGKDIFDSKILTKIFIKLRQCSYAEKLHWDFKLKQCLNLKLEYERLKEFHNPESLQNLKSRARTDETIKKHKEQFQKFLTETKKELLSSSHTVQSNLGSTEIEGLIIRNPVNGAMAKIVDLDDFGARRLEQWSGVGKIKEFRKEVFRELTDN